MNEVGKIIKKEIDKETFYEKNYFEFFKDITNVSDAFEKQELIIRTLDKKNKIPENYHPILNSLIREIGLFPYLSEDFERLSLAEKFSYIYHLPPPDTGDDIVLHREQAKIFSLLVAKKSVILTAPTSFGKSLIIDALIATKEFNNIVIIVPTIALIDETRRRLTKKFSKNYRIITHLQHVNSINSKKIYILTQERYLSDEIENIDFFIIDECYKLNNSDERGNLLNLAFNKLLKKTNHFYLLGPSVKDISENIKNDENINFEYCDLKKYTTVATNFYDHSDIEKKENKNLKLLEICSEFFKKKSKH